ncbi:MULTISPECIES: glutaminase A [Geobacillus]|jgi:glutaminase|uniref:Glutaminase n=2 Tax=Geobacillus thermodenitrificans TaxID=33940 RepID=GLSA_GEOTN|nr:MULTISPECIES: glutaminase A [Geobacillus]A4IPX2.1 RecName: Full=Glutaminase [Geobacillus thermodenitrificans NG80-2]ABO67376.1 Glutaminase [Geobacillus thermodenitrificans NG80-2]ARP43154.1 Glutaminase [Geobacillus thermodenitrificans]ATO38798.1 glutaminase A [Geobacillus thermodenitrificans]KQB92946.1 Glutaminase [Geobacillus sp. PA-3]MED3904980.1 glutaminase A [Geobacillus thermodenitrificans]
MPVYNKEELVRFVEEAKQYARYGKVADYIPALGKANPNELSIAVYTADGKVVDAGDVTVKVTLQSISKILALALVLIDRGEDEVFRKVGMEPTGDPFNSIAKLEEVQPSKPLNPMINAGALAVTHMIRGRSVEERLERLLAFIRRLAGNEQITYSEEVAQSEFETAFLNRSLCYFLKQHGIIDEDVEELMDLYTKQCAVEMTCIDLARIGLVFALDGRDPHSGELLMPLDVARICKTFMVTCGMYNASGEFAIKIGIPAKSGVSGGILAAVPGRCGIGIFGPALDDKGNSLTGVKLLERLSKTYSLSIF